MAKQVKFDFHLHVGEVFAGNGKGTPAEPARCAAYLKENAITHAMVCYSDKAAMSELVKLCPGIKFYKLQWITDFNQKLDKGIAGVKLHSHRGSGFSFGEDAAPGLDYASKAMRLFLAKLPEGFIVEYHTQGSTSLSSASRPFVIGKLAIEFRHLKHVIVHSGAFGMRSFYPSNYDANLLTTAVAQEMLVQEAVLMANRLANVYCDTSTLTGPSHYKTDLLFSTTDKVALGSDWPYSEVCPYGPMHKLEELATRYLGEAGTQAIHDRALAWVNTPVAELFKDAYAIANVQKGRSQKYFEIRSAIDSKKKKQNG